MSGGRPPGTAPLADAADAAVEVALPDDPAALADPAEDCAHVDDYLVGLVGRNDVEYCEHRHEHGRETFEATRERARRLKGAAVVVVADAGGLLLLENDWMDGYGFPGGGVEPGEDWEAAAVREVREETGVVVEIERPLGVYGGVVVCGDDSYRGIYGVT